MSQLPIQYIMKGLFFKLSQEDKKGKKGDRFVFKALTENY